MRPSTRSRRSVPSASMRSSRALRQALDQPLPGTPRSSPRRPPGRRGRGTSRGGRRRRTRAVPMPACWAPAGVGQSVPHQRRRSAASRTGARRARRGRSAPGRRRRARVVFSGAWMISDASVPSASASSAGAKRVEVRVARGRPPALALAGQLGAQQRPGAALEQLALHGEQERRRERRRAHHDLLARLRVEAVAAQQAGEVASGSVDIREVLGEVLAQHVADPAALVRAWRSGSGRAAPSAG